MRTETARSRMKILVTALAGIALLGTAVFSATLMEEKLNLERSIQERAEHLVEKIIGSRDMVVLANVELEAEQQGKNSNFNGSGIAEEELLPGITYASIPVRIGNKATTIKKISVLVTLDSTVSEAMGEQVRKELFEFLGLNPVRSDAVNIKKIPFAKHDRSWKEYLNTYAMQIYWILALLLLSVFLFGPLRSFFNSIARTKLEINADTKLKAGDLGEAMGSAGSLSMTPKLTLALEKEGPGGGGSSKHFTFIKDSNLKNLIFLLKKEPVEKAAIVLSFLPSQYAAEVLASLTEKDQCRAAQILSEKKLLQSAEVYKVEEEIKDRIDYLAGGIERFSDLVENLPGDNQEKMLELLASEDAVLAGRLRNIMFFFKDIVFLDRAGIQKLVRAAQARKLSFAVAMKSCPEDIRKKVLEALPEGAGAILAEEMNLQKDVPEARIREEQRMIAQLARFLEKANEITVARPEVVVDIPADRQSGTSESKEKEALEADKEERKEGGEIGDKGVYVDVDAILQQKKEMIARQMQEKEQIAADDGKKTADQKTDGLDLGSFWQNRLSQNRQDDPKK